MKPADVNTIKSDFTNSWSHITRVTLKGNLGKCNQDRRVVSLLPLGGMWRLMRSGPCVTLP